MFEKTKAFCDSFLEMGVPGFDLAVYKDGACALRYMNGYADLENKIPVQGNERYRLYSCSKPITCTAALQLWEKGLFGLEDKLSDYLPEYAQMTVQSEEGGPIVPAENPILIRHLFQMAAGFSYNYRSPKLVELRERTNEKCSTREVVRALAGEPLLFEPGTRYKYSLCHDVLAGLIEVLTGQYFEDYVKQNIFEPLGMSQSTFYLPDEELDTLACLYRFDSEQNRAVEIPRSNYRVGKRFVSGGGGCISTVDDYVKFGVAMCKGDVLLKKDTIQMMTRDWLTPEQKAFYPGSETSYGLGVRVPSKGSWRTEFGWGGTAGAYIAMDPVHDLAIFYVQHLHSAPNHKMRGNLYSLIMEEYGFEHGSKMADAEDPGNFRSVVSVT